MIKRLARLLGNMVGSKKKLMNMIGFAIGLGAVLLPLGVFLMEQGIQPFDFNFGALFGLLGLGLLSGAGILVWIKDKTDKKEEQEKKDRERQEQGQADTRWELQMQLLRGMLDELKKLRGGKDDKPDSGKPD